MARPNGIVGLVQALIGFLALGGGALGGFHILDNSSEDLPKTVVSRAVGAVAKSATGQAAGPAPIVSAALMTAAAATGLAPVEDGEPDWVAPHANTDQGASASATSNYGSATCDCSCTENETFGEKMMRILPFLGFLPGVT